MEKKKYKYTYEPFATLQPLRGTAEVGMHPNLSTDDKRFVNELNQHEHVHPAVIRRAAEKADINFNVWDEDTEAHYSIEELAEISKKLGGIASQLASVPWHKRLGSEYRETKAALGRERADLKLDETYIGHRLDKITHHGSLPEMEE